MATENKRLCLNNKLGHLVSNFDASCYINLWGYSTAVFYSMQERTCTRQTSKFLAEVDLYKFRVSWCQKLSNQATLVSEDWTNCSAVAPKYTENNKKWEIGRGCLLHLGTKRNNLSSITSAAHVKLRGSITRQQLTGSQSQFMLSISKTKTQIDDTEWNIEKQSQKEIKEEF